MPNNTVAVAPLSWFSTVTQNGTACLESNPGVHYTYQILFAATGVCDVYYGKVDRNAGTVSWVLMGTRGKVEKAIVFANAHNEEPTY